MNFDEYVEKVCKEEKVGKETVKKYFECKKMINCASLEKLACDENGDNNYDSICGMPTYETADPVWEAECEKMLGKLEHLKKYNKKEYKEYKKKLEKLFADYAA